MVAFTLAPPSILPAVILPVALIKPPVKILPPMMLPVPVTTPDPNNMLPPVILAVVVIVFDPAAMVPTILAPVTLPVVLIEPLSILPMPLTIPVPNNILPPVMFALTLTVVPV